MNDGNFLVSICCLTYNHEKNIGKALDGFLLQKTNFNIEIIVHDDASTDGTREIIEEYTEKHPQIFRPVFQQKNLYSSGTGIYKIYTQHVLPLARGKYIAICEGDDYWTAPQKLQKQIDFLEKNGDYAICFHKAGFTGDEPTDFLEHEKYYSYLFSQKDVFSFTDLIHQNFIPNCTVVYRNSVKVYPQFFDDCIFPDWPLHLIYANTGKIKFLDEFMAVHFKRREGLWEGITTENQINGVYQFYTGLLRYVLPVFYPAILQAIEKHTRHFLIPDFSDIFNLGYSLGVSQEKQNTQNIQRDLTLIFNSYTWKTANSLRVISEKIFPKETQQRKLAAAIFGYLLKMAKAGQQLTSQVIDRLKSKNEKLKTVKVTNKVWPANRPLVSIIIPSFNHGKYIGQTIQSVLDQTWQNLEIIIVDGGSTDGETIEVLKNISHPKIRVFLREGRHLVGSNRNYGIEKAMGKYMSCLDSDDFIEPTYVEKAIFYLEVFHNDVVCSWVETFGAKTQLWRTSAGDFETLTKVANTVAMNALFRKEAWDRVSGFGDYRPGENQIPEDWEFWARLAGHGYRFGVISEPLLKHRIHARSLSTHILNNQSEQLQEIRNANIGLKTPHFINLRRQKSQIAYAVKKPFVNLESSKSKNRILVALPYMEVGGIDNLFINVFGELAKKYEIIFITTLNFDERFGDDTKHFQKISHRIYHLPRFLSNENEMRTFILYLVRALRIDLMYIAGSEFCYHCLPEIKKENPNLKVVDILFMGSVHIENSRRYSKFIDVNIVENEISQNHLIQVYNVPPKKIRLIHTGINISNFSIKRDAQLLKKQFGIPDEKFIVAFVARFSYEKQPAFFVEIAKKISDTDIFFFMAGKGPQYDEVVDLIQNSRLQNNILTPGFVDSHDVLSFADVLLLPSTNEGRPLIVLEAMSMGVPVIASNIGGLPTMIKDGENGFLLEPNDMDGFARKIILLKENKVIYQKIKMAAQNFAVEEFDEKIMHSKYQTLVSGLIENEK